MEQFKKLVQEFLKLDDITTSCYEYLLLKGHLTVGELCGYLNLDVESEYTQIQEVCEKLVKSGLAKKVSKAGKIVDVYLPISPFNELAAYLEKFNTEFTTELDKMDKGLKEIRTSTEKKLNTTIDQFNQTMQKSFQETSTDLEKGKTTITDQCQNASESAQGKFTSMAGEITKNTDSTKAKISDMVGTFQRQTGTAIDKTSSSVNERLNTSMAKATGQLTNFKTNQQKSIEDFATAQHKTLETTSGEIQNGIKTQKTEQEGQLKKFVDTQKTANKSWLTSTNEELSGYSAGTQENVTKFMNSYTEATTDLNETFNQESKEWLDKMGEQLETHEKTTTETLEKLNSTGTTELTTQMNASKTKMSKMIEDRQNMFQNSLQESSQTVTKTLDAEITAFRNQLGTQQQTFSKLIEKEQENCGVTIQNMEKAIETRFEGLRTQLQQQIEKTLTEEKTSLFKSIQIIREGFDKELKSFSGAIQDRLHTMEQMLQSQIGNLKGQVTKSTTVLMATVRENHLIDQNSFEKTIDEALKSWKVNIEKLQQSWTTSFSNLMKEIIGNAENLSNTQKEKLKTSIKDHLKQFNDIKAELDKNLLNTIARLQKSAQNKSDTFDTGIVDNLNQLSDKVTKNTTEFTQKVNNCLTISQTEMTTQKKQFIETLGKLNEVISTDLTAMSKDLNSSVRTDLEGIKKNTMDLGSTTLTQTQSSVDSIARASLMTVQQIKMVCEDVVQSTQGFSVELMTKLNNLIIDHGTKAKDAIISQHGDTGKFMLEKVEKTSNTMIDPLKRIKQTTEQREKFLKGVWEDSFKWELLGAEGSWLLYNQATIQNYLRSMIARTKMNCFILVPNLSWVPMDVIKKVKKTQKITIACGPDLDEAIAKELVAIGPNIMVRVINEKGMEPIGGERDREEAFLGPVVKKADEMVALVSIQEEIIALLGDVLGQYWRGRSRKYGESGGA